MKQSRVWAEIDLDAITHNLRRIREIGYEGSLCIETAPFAHGPDYTAESWRQMVADTRVLASPAAG